MFWVQSDSPVADIYFECDVTKLMVISSILQRHWQRYRWTAACRSDRKKCRNMPLWTTTGRSLDRAAALMPPCESPQPRVSEQHSESQTRSSSPVIWCPFQFGDQASSTAVCSRYRAVDRGSSGARGETEEDLQENQIQGSFSFHCSIKEVCFVTG